jgi:hypothetical protein
MFKSEIKTITLLRQLDVKLLLQSPQRDLVWLVYILSPSQRELHGLLGGF